MGGFTNREGLGPASAEERRRPVVVFARRIGDKGDAVHVCEKGTGVVAWLPRSQVRIEEGGFIGAAQSPGDYLRITLPLWLAEDRGFRTATDERQGVLL